MGIPSLTQGQISFSRETDPTRCPARSKQKKNWRTRHHRRDDFQNVLWGAGGDFNEQRMYTNPQSQRDPENSMGRREELRQIDWNPKNPLPHVNFSGESVGAPISLGSAFSPLAGRACRAAAQTGCLQSIVREKGSHKDREQKERRATYSQTAEPEPEPEPEEQQGERSRTRTSAGGTNTVHRTIPA